MSQQAVLITGANRGIGLELVKNYVSADGWTVHACCRDPESADELQSIAQGSGDRVHIHSLDVSNAGSVAALSAAMKGQKLDVLINNAGIMGGDRQSAFDMDFEAWEETFKVNTIAPLRVVQAVIENLRLSSQPKIITISSQMGSLNRKSKGRYAYRTSKTAVNKVMQLLSLDLADEGFIVCPFHPGWVQTDMGGPAADITVQESAAGLFKVISSLTPQDTGRFLQWNGTEHPW